MIHTLFDELLLWFKRLGCKNYGIKALKVSFILQFSKISNHSDSSSWVFQTMPLKTNRQMLAWLWILPTTSKWKKVSYIIFSFILFTSNVGALVTSYVYFAKNLSTDLEEALYAMLQVKAILFFFFRFMAVEMKLFSLQWNQVAAFFGLNYMIITAFIFRHEFGKIIKTLTKIYETSKCFKINSNADGNS